MKKSIETALNELARRNSTTRSDVRGGAFALSIERDEDGEPWVQLKAGVLNFFYPFEDDPAKRVKLAVAALPDDAACVGWEPWKYATFEYRDRSPAEVASLVESLFTDLYEFPSDTPVTLEFIDTR